MAEKGGLLIFLHGLGDTGNGWQMQLWRRFHPLGLDVLCPDAPTAPVTLNGGMRMTSWLDISALETIDDEATESFRGMAESVASITSLIKKKKQLGYAKVFLGGFSQGAAIASRVAYSLEEESLIDGVILLSGYLPQMSSFRKEPSSIPCIAQHGEADAVVSLAAGKRLHAAVRSIAELTADYWPGMGHSSCPQEMKKVEKWIVQRLTGT